MPRVVRPLVFPDTCEDRRYPRLEGLVVVYCGPQGAADQALDLVTRARGPVAERDEKGVRDPVTPVTRALGKVAYGAADYVSLFEEGAPSQLRFPSRPAPWYPPAIGDGWLVWTGIEAGDLDLLAVRGNASDPEVLAGGPGAQHHPVAEGARLAWIDRGDVVITDTAAGTRSRVPADAGFESGPVLLDGLVCWEDRGGDEIVTRCDDGWSVPGRMPSGSGALLLVHTRLGAVLYALEGAPLPAGLR